MEVRDMVLWGTAKMVQDRIYHDDCASSICNACIDF
jgi:hypothetical protein